MYIWFIMPLCAIVLLIMWFIFGRERQTIPAITTSPPEGLDPLEMEYAQIVTITDRGIFAMLLYWVSKGILQVRNDEDHIGVEKIRNLEDDRELKDSGEHARFLFDGMFGKSDLVWLDGFPQEVTDHKSELKNLVGERFRGNNAVVQDDSMKATIAAIGLLIAAIFVVEVMIDVSVLLSVILAVLLFVGLAFLQNGALGFRSKYDNFEVIAGTIGTALILIVHLILVQMHTGSILFTCIFGVCFIICVPAILFMERRVNQKLYGQILGFRTYIETAEWERLKHFSEEDPDDLSYGMDILPYAMLFHMGTKWTAKFENKAIINCVEEMERLAGEE